MQPARRLLYVSTHPCPEALREQLALRQWELVHVRGLKVARAWLQAETFFVALLDISAVRPRTPGEFQACREACDACEWVALLPSGALQSATMRDVVLRHCFDHHTHPADPVFLCQSLGHAFGRAVLRSGAAAAAPVPAARELALAGRGTAVARLRRMLGRAAATDAPVLLNGEGGSGKEVAARAIHDASIRARGPFVVLDCTEAADIDHLRTFAQAESGTLYLRGVAALPREGQARLVRFLLEAAVIRAKLGRHAAVNARVIAGSDRDLAQAVGAGLFRQDLYDQLAVLCIHVPPLRERMDDLHALAQQALGEARRRGGQAQGFTREALAAMAAHPWPGNIREFRNRVQGAALLAEGRLIGPHDLGLAVQGADDARGAALQAVRVAAERDAIATSLIRFRQNVSLAARELGVSRMTLYRLMAKHSIAPGKAAP